MKTILVPLSYLEKGSYLLQYAFDFAEIFSAKIIILKSFGIETVTGPSPDIDNALQEKCLRELKEILTTINTKNCVYEIVLFKGKLVENCAEFLQENPVDLIISTPKRSTNEPHLFVGNVTGKMIKNLECPILLVPKNFTFEPITSVLMAIKSGVIKKERVLTPLQNIQETFKAKVSLLQVKTPKLKEKDFIINSGLLNLKTCLIRSENATIYHGVLEYLHQVNPNLLCVIRRKRGFFSKLWEQNTVKKADFESKVPLLILKGAI